MLNIIKDATAVERLTHVFAQSPVKQLLPPINSERWKQVAANPQLTPLMTAIRERALAEIDGLTPELSVKLYADFFATGQRLPFERPYFERRRQASRAIIAALLEQDLAARETFIRSAVAKLTTIFHETSWTLPAHVWTNPTGQDPMRIDLFAAETAMLFAESLQLLGDRIPTEFRARIIARLREQTWDNYLTATFEWMSISNNWNAVCHQGVLGSALLMCDDANLLGKMFHKAERCIKPFLGGFELDGGSSEGPGYWAYGFGWFVELNQQLEARTHEQLSLVEGDDHAHAIAKFGPRMTLSNGFSVNFSDNGPRSAPGAYVLHLLAQRFDDPMIRSHADIAWQRVLAAKPTIDAHHADVFFFARHLLRAPAAAPAADRLPDGDTYLPNLAVIISRFHDSRGRLWEFAGKAGHNDEHHNHNDIGSYLLNIDGQRVLIDIGAPEYNRAFFSSTRYESIAARSLGHPVPLINGAEQSSGKTFAGKVLAHEFDETRILFRVDLTAAYPAAAGCRRCERSIEILKREGRMTVTDTFDLEHADAVETAVIVDSPIEHRGASVVILAGPTSLRITPLPGSVHAPDERHAYNDHYGQPTFIDRIVIKPAELKQQTSIGYTVELL